MLKTRKSVSQSVSQPASQPASQSVSQSVSQIKTSRWNYMLNLGHRLGLEKR